MNGDDLALHAVLDRLVAEFFGFVFERFVELVDVHVHHLVEALGGFHDDVEGFGSLAEVAFVTLRKGADDVDEFGADVEPTAGFGVDHALERLVGELDRELVLVVFTGAQTRLDRAVFTLGVDVDEGRERRDALLDLVFKERAEATVEDFFGRFALEAGESVPLLLQRAGAAQFENVRAQRVGAVGVGVRVDPTARGHDGGLNHVANREGRVFHGHPKLLGMVRLKEN